MSWPWAPRTWAAHAERLLTLGIPDEATMAPAIRAGRYDDDLPAVGAVLAEGVRDQLWWSIRRISTIPPTGGIDPADGAHAAARASAPLRAAGPLTTTSLLPSSPPGFYFFLGPQPCAS